MKWWHFALFAAVLAMGETARRLLATGYKSGEPFQLELQSIGGGFFLNRVAAAAFVQMSAAAATEGVRFTVNSAFRSNEAQADLRAKFEAGEGAQAAEPGYSNHQQGLAVDVESAGGTNPAFRWLTANAHLYGFARTVSTEPWHWEYVEPWAEALS